MYVFCIYFPLVAAALVWALWDGPTLPVLGAAFAGGLALWTLLEYGIHRYAFHRLAPHHQHHEFPTDRRYIFAPLWFSGISAVILCGLLRLATGSWMVGAVLEAGAVTGYLAYEGLHLVIHSDRPGGAMLRALRKHHYYHHFADDTKCYGVVTPFWDRIFGSLPGKNSA